MELQFFLCERCGNLITLINKGGGPLNCCGQPMKELTANSSDGAHEKHVPVISVSGQNVTVTVGSVEHPMLDAHYIMWICLQTTNGFQVKHLTPGSKPSAVFALADGEKAEKAYAYCNLHGLWKSE